MPHNQYWSDQIDQSNQSNQTDWFDWHYPFSRGPLVGGHQGRVEGDETLTLWRLLGALCVSAFQFLHSPAVQ